MIAKMCARGDDLDKIILLLFEVNKMKDGEYPRVVLNRWYIMGVKTA